MKIKALFLVLFAAAALVSCKKDNFNYPAGTVGISKIVYFPLISINGDKAVAVVQGTAYTDPGATATLNGATAKYTTDLTITSATAPGVYVINYTAANAQGFTASDFRLVAVIPTATATNATVIANDFSGTYARTSNGVTSTWTKLGPGAYSVENAGGATSGVGYLTIAFNTTGNTIMIPSQPSPYYSGTVSSSTVTMAPGPPATYTWVFNAANYGTGARTFVKQ